VTVGDGMRVGVSVAGMTVTFGGGSAAVGAAERGAQAAKKRMATVIARAAFFRPKQSPSQYKRQRPL